MNSYQTDIMAQPVALQDTLEFLVSRKFSKKIKADLQSGRLRRIVLTGMGSSYFALLPLYLRLLEKGMAVWLVETSEMIHANAFFTPDTLVIAASQSGASVEIVRLLERIGGDQTVIGLTNTADGPLFQKASYSVLTQAGDEATVSCKTYVTALAAQIWLGDQLIDGIPEFPGLHVIPQLVKTYLDHHENHIASMKHELVGIEQVYLTGRGTSIASAGTGGLILKESVQIPAEGMSSAGFRHGPFEMVRPQTFVLVFSGVGETVPLNHKLASDISSAGGRTELVAINTKSNGFALPVCPDPALPIMEILPVQMMSLALAELRNITAGSFNLGSKITTTE